MKGDSSGRDAARQCIKLDRFADVISHPRRFSPAAKSGGCSGGRSHQGEGGEQLNNAKVCSQALEGPRRLRPHDRPYVHRLDRPQRQGVSRRARGDREDGYIREGADGIECQQEAYPGLTVSRDGDAIIVRISVRFYRCNGRQMVLSHGGVNGLEERESIGTIVSALARAFRWQGQLESGEYASLKDFAGSNGVDCTQLGRTYVDRNYVGRILPLTSSLLKIWSGSSLGMSQRGLAWRSSVKRCAWYGKNRSGVSRAFFATRQGVRERRLGNNSSRWH